MTNYTLPSLKPDPSEKDRDPSSLAQLDKAARIRIQSLFDSSNPPPPSPSRPLNTKESRSLPSIADFFPSPSPYSTRSHRSPLKWLGPQPEIAFALLANIDLDDNGGEMFHNVVNILFRGPIGGGSVGLAEVRPVSLRVVARCLHDEGGGNTIWLCVRGG